MRLTDRNCKLWPGARPHAGILIVDFHARLQRCSARSERRAEVRQAAS